MSLLIGKELCRGCSSNQLFEVMDFGNLPLANELTLKPIKVQTFPLTFSVCRSCGLGQIQNGVTPQSIFCDYRYTSSTSKKFLSHAANFVNKVIASNLVKPQDLILEIASNDGYLLRNFPNHNFRLLGVEPAENIAQIAMANGVETLVGFFDEQLAKTILEKSGHPKLVIANNVLAHVPHLDTFIKGLSLLADHDTLISIENPSIVNLLERLQFDTIYHEHFSYLSATSVNIMMKRYGLELFKIEVIDVHGGTNRYWIRKIQNKPIDQSVTDEMLREKDISSESEWKIFSKEVLVSLNSFRNWVSEKNSSNEKIFGFGAAAKASTFLNMAQINSGDITAIFDNSQEKINRYMPNLGIPILEPKLIADLQVDHLLIFPWNLSDELILDFRKMGQRNARFWHVIPSIFELEAV